MEIRGKVVLVTGGARRVGKAISLGIGQLGAHVAIHYHGSKQGAHEALAAIEAAGSKGCVIPGDFSSLADIRRVVDTCISELGGLDILINNAAVFFKTPVFTTHENEWDRLFALNLKAPYFCSSYAAAHMRKHGSGKIISIADTSANNPWPDYIPYCTSKAGLIAMTKGLAKALAPEIQVNAVASGTVLMAENATAEHTQKIAAATLLKRIGSPADIVRAIKFLVEDGDYVTGEILTVDGGRHLA